jgi:hypothetical protein
MAWPSPEFTKGEVNKAGQVLVGSGSSEDLAWAYRVLGNWRACHGYPINTFQATLRGKLGRLGINDALVAQRLKRTPSIITKLKRFDKMQLARMQDIGGLRAVVATIADVRRLQEEYKKGAGPFRHELISEKDYIKEPKTDGYRSVHLVFRYKSKRAPAYDGLSIELQIRTKLQHAWATAVETMSTFLGKALKADQGDREWQHFFAITASAFAYLESSPLVPGYQHLYPAETSNLVMVSERGLGVLAKLKAFSHAVHDITRAGKGTYHLITLDSAKKTVTICPYSRTNLSEAVKDYAQIEARALGGEPIEAVLVSAGPVSQLRRAYPNYFLDTNEFVTRVEGIIKSATGHEGDVSAE